MDDLAVPEVEQPLAPALAGPARAARRGIAIGVDGERPCDLMATVEIAVVAHDIEVAPDSAVFAGAIIGAMVRDECACEILGLGLLDCRADLGVGHLKAGGGGERCLTGCERKCKRDE